MPLADVEEWERGWLARRAGVAAAIRAEEVTRSQEDPAFLGDEADPETAPRQVLRDVAVKDASWDADINVRDLD
jgi:hypothetical protein